MAQGIVQFQGLFSKLAQEPRNYGMEGVARSARSFADRMERMATRRQTASLMRSRLEAEERRHRENLEFNREKAQAEAATDWRAEEGRRIRAWYEAQGKQFEEVGRAHRGAEDVRVREAATAEDIRHNRETEFTASEQAQIDRDRENRLAFGDFITRGIEIARNQREGRLLELRRQEFEAKTDAERKDLALRSLQYVRQSVDDVRNELAEGYAGIEEKYAGLEEKYAGTPKAEEIAKEKAAMRGRLKMGTMRHILGIFDEVGVGDAEAAAEQVIRGAEARGPFLRLKARAQAAMSAGERMWNMARDGMNLPGAPSSSAPPGTVGGR